MVGEGSTLVCEHRELESSERALVVRSDCVELSSVLVGTGQHIEANLGILRIFVLSLR